VANNNTWGLNDSVYGGETFTSSQTRPRLRIVKGDRFRVEIGAKGKVTLIPHPDNVGTWNQSHSNANPVRLTKVAPGPNKRAFSMMVTKAAGLPAEKLFLVERKNLTVAIKRRLGGGGANDGTASVEH
jgi:hypothetical protein